MEESTNNSLKSLRMTKLQEQDLKSSPNLNVLVICLAYHFKLQTLCPLFQVQDNNCEEDI